MTLPLFQSKEEPRVNADMLIIAREARGFNQSDLAKQANISQANISKFERGQLAVSLENLQRIAQATHFPESFFFLPERRYNPLSEKDSNIGIYHQRQTTMLKGDLRGIHAKLNLLRIQISRLLWDAKIEHETTFPSFHPSDSGRSIEEVARQVREQWDLPSGPIDSMVDVIEAAGGIIVMNQFATMKLSGVTQYIQETGMSPLIFLNAEMSGDRQRWTLAHELAHIVLHCQHIDDPTLCDLEDEADRFASEFLMPASDIGPSLSNLNLPALTRLKALWKVPMDTLILRASKLGRISDRQKRTLFQQMNANRYRGNGGREPITIPVEEPTLLNELLYVHRNIHGHSLAELSRLLVVHEDELRYTYGLEHGSNDWSPKASASPETTGAGAMPQGLWVETT